MRKFLKRLLSKFIDPRVITDDRTRKEFLFRLKVLWSSPKKRERLITGKYSQLYIDFVRWVSNNYPSMIAAVNINDEERHSVMYYVQHNRFNVILRKYGIEMLLLLSGYYQHMEEYEVCARINSSITEHNSIFNDSLPYDLKELVK